MGTEIVFVLILPMVALCLPTTALLWSRVAKIRWEAGGGPLRAFVPLLAGFTVSMLGLILYTYVECYMDFTSLVQEGYYTEGERAVYLPARAFGQATVELLFVLPTIAFLVVPLTIWLIKRRRLTFRGIGLCAVVSWMVLSTIGSIVYFTSTSSYPSLSFLASTAIPVLLYGLPIPVAAISFFGPRVRPQTAS